MSQDQAIQVDQKKERHITELAGPDDCWLSITDASRVARRQEHTIRSWVGEGLLPVHPERVGINKKTRRVRLSDLAKLTPIIDIDAAIISETGKLDLPSIPRQQQKIREEHEQLSARFSELSGEVKHLLDALHEQEEVFRKLVEDLHGQLKQQDKLHQQALQSQYQALTELQETQRAQVQEMLAALTLEQKQAWEAYQHSIDISLQQCEQQIYARIEELKRSVVGIRDDLAGQISTLDGRFNVTIQELEQRLSSRAEELAQQLSKLEEHLSRTDQAVEAYRQHVQRQLKELGEQHQQHREKTQQSLEHVKEELEEQKQQGKKLEEKVAGLEKQLAQYEKLLPLASQLETLQHLLAKREEGE